MGVDRAAYASLYGPTVGDRVRLGDTDLEVEVEHDDTAPGWEPLIGFGKTVREGILMTGGDPGDDLPDVVVTNVLLIDPVLGVRKTSIGIRGGRITALGRAGNPDRMDGVTVPIGPFTGVVPGEGLIATPGVIDSHVHLNSPRLLGPALAGAVTTVVAMGYGGAWDIGIGPARHLEVMLDAWRTVPINLLPLARASTTRADVLEEAVAWGAGGLKVHEDTGARPAVIDAALTAAERHDVQVAMHLDGLGETATLPESLAAIAGRAVHLYHLEGAGGGPPDLLEAASHDNVLPSSTNPTIPYGATAVDEHETMIATVHRLHPRLANDAAAARDRVRPWTMAAEAVLHDLGAISILSSDAMGMGRIGETFRRAFQLAHVMKGVRGGGEARGGGAERRGDGEVGRRGDNARVLRYLAKLTINPALVHGIASDVGSLEVGKLADIALWRPAFFAAKPQLVLKAGFAAYGALGSGDASTRLGEPILLAPQWGGHGAAPAALATIYASAAGAEPLARRWPGRVVPVAGCRALRKRDLVRNGATPEVRVRSEPPGVLVDGVSVELEPARDLPLHRGYFLV